MVAAPPLRRGADLHMAQLMPMPPFWYRLSAHLGSPGKRPLNGLNWCVCLLRRLGRM